MSTKYSNLDIFESALNIKSGSMPLTVLKISQGERVKLHNLDAQLTLNVSEILLMSLRRQKH